MQYVQGIEAVFTPKKRQNRLRSTPSAQTNPCQGGEQCAHGRRAYSRMLQRRVRRYCMVQACTPLDLHPREERERFYFETMMRVQDRELPGYAD